MATRPWKTLMVAILLGMAGLVAVTLWLGEPSDLRQLLSLSPGVLAGAVALLLASFLGGGARLQALLAMGGERLNIWRASRAHILGLFAAAITPSGGGNGVAIGFAVQRDGVKADVAWAAAVYGSVLDLFFFTWTLPVGGLILHRSGLISAQLLWLAFAISAVCFLLWYGLAFHLGRVRHLLAPLLSWRLLKRWRRPTLRFLDELTRATRTITRGGLLRQVGLHMLTLPVHVTTYAIFYVFAVALGGSIGLPQTLSLLALISAASQVVPTPGGAGYFEVALTFAFSEGGTRPQVTAVVVAWRALTFYAPILLGALLGGGVLISELSRPTQPAAADTPHKA